MSQTTLTIFLAVFLACALAALLVTLRTKSAASAAVCVCAALLTVGCALLMLLEPPQDETVRAYIPITKYSETTTRRQTARSTRQAAEPPQTEDKTATQPTITQPLLPDDIVYITQHGTKYHCDPACGAGDYYECPLRDALERGLEPCQRCFE